jgi:hypothetical protein
VPRAQSVADGDRKIVSSGGNPSEAKRRADGGKSPKTTKPKAVRVAELASPKPGSANPSALQAISMLHELLEQIFAAPGPTDLATFDATKIKRYRLSCAAHVIGNFLKQTGGQPEVYKPICELGAALYDLDRGALHPALERDAVGHRPADRTDIWCARARAVLGFECLQATMTAPDVTRKVAKDFPGLQRLCGFKQHSGANKLSSSLVQWRRSLKEPTLNKESTFNIEVRDAFAEGVKWVASRKKAYRDDPKLLAAIGEHFLKEAEMLALAISPLSPASGTK